jgi:DNA-directed RNA polymerase specialized sigma24 family protein
MADNDYAWLRYADLQQRSRKAQDYNDYAWGIESALNYLLNVIENDTTPSNPADLDAAVNRAIASGARRERSRALALKKWVLPSEPMPTNTAAEAKIELEKISCTVKEADEQILFDAGLGYTDREIASRHASTPGAIRVRLSRLRLKLGAKGHSTARPAAGLKTTYPSYGVHSTEPQSTHQAA